MSTSYGIGSHAYLQRAGQRLAEQTAEALFYAALELRCAIEARQDEYIDAQKEYVRSIPKAWRIKDQGTELDRVFDNKLIQHLVLRVPGHDAWEVYHVPVSDALRTEAARLKDFLHAQSKSYPDDDSWWEKTRQRLCKVYVGVWNCCQGHLLSPVLLKRGEMTGRMLIEFPADQPHLARALPAGARFTVTVDYLQEPPASWKPPVIDGVFQPSVPVVRQPLA